jgi:hypothetical protein
LDNYCILAWPWDNWNKRIHFASECFGRRHLAVTRNWMFHMMNRRNCRHYPYMDSQLELGCTSDLESLWCVFRIYCERGREIRNLTEYLTSDVRKVLLTFHRPSYKSFPLLCRYHRRHSLWNQMGRRTSLNDIGRFARSYRLGRHSNSLSKRCHFHS